MPVDIGTGASVAFGTSGFTANVTSFGWNGMERVAIQTSHLGTTTAHTFIPGDLFDPGELEMEIQFDCDDYPPIEAVAETITLTFPTGTGGTTGGSWAASGFATGFTASVPLEDLMTGTLTCKFTGDITDTDQV